MCLLAKLLISLAQVLGQSLTLTVRQTWGDTLLQSHLMGITLYLPIFFKAKTMCEIKLPIDPDCVNIKLDNEPDNGIHDFFLADMSFNVPNHRRNLWVTSNIRWLLRNLGIQNRNHPDLEENIQDLKELLNFVENQPKLGEPC